LFNLVLSKLLSSVFLSIPDLCRPSEIRTFRCYEGTAHKLRPSPFRTRLWSPEFIILLPEPNRTWGKVVDNEADHSKGTPSARVHVRVDSVVDRRERACRRVRVRKLWTAQNLLILPGFGTRDNRED
jgi:hypothetical protein